MGDREDEEPGFADSIGLYRTPGHPEVIKFSLGEPDLHAAINGVAAEVRRGKLLGQGDRSDEILEGFPAAPVSYPARVATSCHDLMADRQSEPPGAAHAGGLACPLGVSVMK